MLDYAWFAGHLNRLSRQSIKTLVKAIAVTPHRRKGQWIFRDNVGREPGLPDVFAALMNSPVARTRLEQEYSHPILAEEEWRNRQIELRRTTLEKIVDSCRFLIEELGYSEPFELPATIDNTWILAYRNAVAGRQVEVSSQSGETFHCEIRKLVDGVASAYRVESFGDWEIRAFREPAPDDPWFVADDDAALAQIVATLRRHSDLLTGERWLDRADLDAAFEAGMRRRGLLPDISEVEESIHSSIEDDVKRVLTGELGFVTTYDSSTLTPHERQMWETFRFKRGETIVELSHTDIRAPHEWSLRMNGEVVAQTLDDILPALTRLRESTHVDLVVKPPSIA